MKVAMVVVVATLVGSTAAAQDFEFRRELGSGARFTLRNIIGDVRIEGTSGRTVEVRARKVEGRHGDPEDVEIRAFENGGDVAICVFYPGQYSRRDNRRDDDRYDRDDDDRDDRSSRRRRSSSDRSRNRGNSDACRRDGNWSNNNRNDTEVQFTVKVPAGLRLDIKTVSGDVIGRGLRGTMELGSVSGEIELTDAEGESLEASSVSGDITLERINVRELGAETVSGDVTFVGTIEGSGSYDFKTLSGDVVVTLPREPNARVSAVTFSGNLSSDFPVERDGRRRRNRFSGTWGSGSANLDLESFSGDIRVKAAGR